MLWYNEASYFKLFLLCLIRRINLCLLLLRYLFQVKMKKGLAFRLDLGGLKWLEAVIKATETVEQIFSNEFL